MQKIATGFTKLDEKLNGGLKPHGVYYICSEQKAGKSSFIRKMLSNLCSAKLNTLLIDIEQPSEEVFQVLASIDKNIIRDKLTEQDIREVKTKLAPNFALLASENMDEWETDGAIDCDKVTAVLEKYLELGTKAFIFDNVTRAASERSDKSYHHRMNLISSLIKFAKKHKVLMFVIGHIKSRQIDTTTQKEIAEVIKARDFDRLMEMSLTTIKKPESEDLWGGSVLTQFDAIFKLWRPFQKWADAGLQEIAWILVEDVRDCAPFVLRMIYKGETNSWIEYDESYAYSKVSGSLYEDLTEGL